MRKRMILGLVAAFVIGSTFSVYGATNEDNVLLTEEENSYFVSLDEFVERYNSVLPYVNRVFFETDVNEWNVQQIKNFDYTFEVDEVYVMLDLDENNNVEEIKLGIDIDSKNPKNFSATVVSSIYALDKKLSEDTDKEHGADAALRLASDILDKDELEKNDFSYKVAYTSEIFAFDMKRLDEGGSVANETENYVLESYDKLCETATVTEPTIENCYVGEFRSADSYENDDADTSEKDNDIIYVYMKADGEEYYFAYSDNKELEGYMSGKDLDNIELSADIPKYQKELLGMKLQTDYSKMTGWDGWTEYTNSEIEEMSK